MQSLSWDSVLITFMNRILRKVVVLCRGNRKGCPRPRWTAPSLAALLLVLNAARVSQCSALLLCCQCNSTAVVQSTATLCSIVACAECNSITLLQTALKLCITFASAAPSPSGENKQRDPVGRLTESDMEKTTKKNKDICRKL